VSDPKETLKKEIIESIKKEITPPNFNLLKCKDCGFSTDKTEDFINHKISSYNTWLQEQLNKKLEKELCTDALCKKLEEKGFKLIKKDEWENLGKKEPERKQPTKTEWKLF